MIQPLNNNIVVKEIKPTLTTESGMILPENEDNDIIKGEIVNNDLHDIVIFPAFKGTKVLDNDGIEYIIIPEKEILAIIK